MSKVIGEPLSQLPPSPKKPNGDTSDFLKKLGIGVGVGITIVVVLASLKKLTEEFPDIPPDVIAALLEQGLTEKQVRDILKKLLAGGMTPDQIRQSLQKLIDLGLSQEQIANFYKSHAKDIPAIWAAYLQVSHIPGIDRVLYAVANGSKTDYKGYVFQLNWIVAYQAEIARVEATDPSNQSAADIIMTDGTVIDVKSYNWQSQKNLDALLSRIGKGDKTTIQRILKQIQRYKDLYKVDHQEAIESFEHWLGITQLIYNLWHPIYAYTFNHNGSIPPTSREDIEAFKPEWLYEINLFGPEMVQKLGGREYVLAAPAHIVRPLDDGGVLLIPEMNLYPGVLQFDWETAADYLGLACPDF